MPKAFNLIYTYDLRGNLALLSRLYTHIKTLQSELTDPTYRIDLGKSCVPDVWPCGVTQGRATLMVLDAMGYQVVQVGGVLNAAAREKVRDQVAAALIDRALPHIVDGLHFVADADDAADKNTLAVIMQPTEKTSLKDGRVYLQAVHGAQIGVVQINGQAITAAVHDLPANTPPDATIAGVVDFVTAEAQYYERQHRK